MGSRRRASCIDPLRHVVLCLNLPSQLSEMVMVLVLCLQRTRKTKTEREQRRLLREESSLHQVSLLQRLRLEKFKIGHNLCGVVQPTRKQRSASSDLDVG